MSAVALIALLPGSLSAADFRAVTSTEIRIGQTMPYSGPVSAFGAHLRGAANRQAAPHPDPGLKPQSQV